MKKLVLGALVFILVVAGVGAGIYFNNPKVVVKNALAGFAEDLAKRPEVEPLVNMANKGSLEMNAEIDSSKFNGTGILEIVEDDAFEISAGGKFYFGKEAFYIENLNADILLEEVDIDTKLSANVYVGAKDGLIYVENDEILDGTIGIVKGEMADAYKGSIFQDMVPEDFNKLAEAAFEVIDDIDYEEAQKDLEKIADRYSKLLEKTFSKNAEFDSEKDEVKVGGEKIDSRIITVTLDEDAMVAIIEDLFEEFENDDELLDYFEKYGSPELYDMLMYLMVEFMDVPDPEMDFDEAWDMVMETAGDAIAELTEELGDMDLEVTIEIVTPKFTSTMRKISVFYEIEGEKETLLTADFGKDGIAKATNIELAVMDKITLGYEVENNKEEYAGKLTLTAEDLAESVGMDADIILLTIDIDKDKDTFRISLPIMKTLTEQEVSVSGNWASKKGTHTIEINKLVIGEESSLTKGASIKFVINEKDKMPKPLDADDVTNIFDLKEDDFEKIAENFSDIFMSEKDFAETESK